MLDHSIVTDHLVLQMWFVGQAPALQAVPELCDQGTIRVPAVAVQLNSYPNDEKISLCTYEMPLLQPLFHTGSKPKMCPYVQDFDVPRLDILLGDLIGPLGIESLAVVKDLDGLLPLPLLELPLCTRGEHTNDAVPVLGLHVVRAVDHLVVCLLGLVGLLATLNLDIAGLGLALVAQFLAVHEASFCNIFGFCPHRQEREKETGEKISSYFCVLCFACSVYRALRLFFKELLDVVHGDH